jgi:hypothetical protein
MVDDTTLDLSFDIMIWSFRHRLRVTPAPNHHQQERQRSTSNNPFRLRPNVGTTSYSMQRLPAFADNTEPMPMLDHLDGGNNRLAKGVDEDRPDSPSAFQHHVDHVVLRPIEDFEMDPPEDVFTAPRVTTQTRQEASPSPIQVEYTSTIHLPDLAQHSEDLSERARKALRFETDRNAVSPGGQHPSRGASPSPTGSPNVPKLRQYKSKMADNEAVIANFAPRRSLPQKVKNKVDPVHELEDERPVDDAMNSPASSSVADENAAPVRDSDTQAVTSARQHFDQEATPSPTTSRSEIETERPSIFAHLAAQAFGHKQKSSFAKSPLTNRSLRKDHASTTRATGSRNKRRPEIGVVGSQPLLPQAVTSHSDGNIDQGLTTDVEKDMYLTFGLLMKTKEREKALKETVSSAP